MKKLLVLDDEVGICEFLKAFFSGKKYEVFTATTGEEALEIVKKEQPQVMLLDMKLPDIQGLEVLRRAKKIDEEIVVVGMTGYKDSELAKDAKELGVEDYIYKPLNLDALEEIAGKLSEKLQK